MPFPFFDETKELNEATRKLLGGSFIELPDGVTHYQLSGPENGIPVVLAHGFSVPSFIFDPTFEFLANAGFRVLRYEPLGAVFQTSPICAMISTCLWNNSRIYWLHSACKKWTWSGFRWADP